MRLIGPALIGCAVLLITGVAQARTNGGELLWQDHFDLAGGEDIARAVAASNGRVVAVGNGQNTAGNSDFVVRAYDQKSGQLLWQDYLDVAGRDDTALAVAVDDQRVVVGGLGIDATGQTRLLLRVYAAKTGLLNWEDRPIAEHFGGLAMDDGGHIVVSGSVLDANGNSRVLVRTYDAIRGALRWADIFVPTGFLTAQESTRGVALHRKTVFVAGSAAPGIFACVVRAYEVETGLLKWESTQATLCRAQAIAADSRHVLLAGIGGSFPDDYLVQAYDAETGATLWRDRTFVSTGTDNEAVAVDSEHKRAFAAGWVRWVPGRGEQQAFLVRAYETDTGTLEWEEQFPGVSDGIGSKARARDIIAEKGHVVAVGVVPGSWLVRSYDAKNGNPLWSDEFVPPGGLTNRLLGALAVAIDDGRVFVVGTGRGDAGSPDFILRVYDAK